MMTGWKIHGTKAPMPNLHLWQAMSIHHALYSFMSGIGGWIIKWIPLFLGTQQGLASQPPHPSGWLCDSSNPRNVAERICSMCRRDHMWFFLMVGKEKCSIWTNLLQGVSLQGRAAKTKEQSAASCTKTDIWDCKTTDTCAVKISVYDNLKAYFTCWASSSRRSAEKSQGVSH